MSSTVMLAAAVAGISFGGTPGLRSEGRRDAILGVFATDDFKAAHLTLGKDYGCQMAPGNQTAFSIVVDTFVFPVNNRPGQKEAQDKLASMMMDPAVQTAVNRIKGSLPARLDASVEGLDAYAQLGAKIIADGPDDQILYFTFRCQP